MVGFNIALLLLVLLVVATLFAGIKQVPQGYQYTIERFGRYTKTLMPGLNLIVPFFDRVGARVNMKEQVLDIPTQEVITRDNATVSVDAVAFFQVLNAAQSAYQVSDLNYAVLNLNMTNLEAEGKREAAYRQAEARERLAEAEAKATLVLSEAIAKGNVQAINYFVAQKYTDALASIGTANNQKVVLMPMEASSLIGSLGGIGAIAKEVFGSASQKK